MDKYSSIRKSEIDISEQRNVQDSHLTVIYVFLGFFSSLSPSQGLCCSSGCVFKTSGLLCEEDSECQMKSVCTGTSATCPQPAAKPNMTVCSLGTRVCLNGVCPTLSHVSDCVFNIHNVSLNHQYPVVVFVVVF